MKVKRITLFAVLSLVILFAGQFVSVKAETGARWKISEIGPNYLKGFTSQEGKIEVYNQNILLGKTQANGDFSINFNQNISTSDLKVHFIRAEEDLQITSVKYEPIKIMKRINDKQKIISGIAVPNAKVYAYIQDKPLLLKKHFKSIGLFEFSPSIDLVKGTQVKLVTERNEVKSVTIKTVVAAPPPASPVIEAISNKDLFIAGTAEMNSTVYIQAGQKSYSKKLIQTNKFKVSLDNNQSLKEGTKVIGYVIDSLGRKSSLVSLAVSDKIPPSVPVINKLTDKSFVISGKTEPGATVFIKRNSVQFGTVKANTSGTFSLPIPLQSNGTGFEIYAIDSSTNKSPSSKTVVTLQSRPAKNILSAPIVKQLPELPRGCEVTSLTMLLNYTGIKADKMQLAKQVKKDPAKYKVINGKKYFGNPNYGFVGDMYSFKTPGFGVFNKPIEALANQYKPNRIVNLSGQSFDSVLNYVGAGHPVWIITTSWFSTVPSEYWQTWYTAQGPVRITMKEHSVLVTGYDSQYVYFNDPLDGQKNKKKPMKSFIEGWKQFGNQAISYY